MTKVDLKKILKETILNFEKDLKSKRMALIGFYGGYEGTFRDILAAELQKVLEDDLLVLTEKLYRDNNNKKKWIDIAILKKNLKGYRILNYIEIKHNLVNNVNIIDRQIEEYEKKDIVLVQLITDIEMPENIRKYLKRSNSITSLEYYKRKYWDDYLFFQSKYKQKEIKCNILIIVK